LSQIKTITQLQRLHGIIPSYLQIIRGHHSIFKEELPLPLLIAKRPSTCFAAATIY
jgi:hypothetical protein